MWHLVLLWLLRELNCIWLGEPTDFNPGYENRNTERSPADNQSGAIAWFFGLSISSLGMVISSVIGPSGLGPRKQADGPRPMPQKQKEWKDTLSIFGDEHAPSGSPELGDLRQGRRNRLFRRRRRRARHFRCDRVQGIATAPGAPPRGASSTPLAPPPAARNRPGAGGARRPYSGRERGSRGGSAGQIGRRRAAASDWQRRCRS